MDKDTIADDIIPLKITPQGNYGVAIQWSDGHDDAIYTYQQIMELVEKEKKIVIIMRRKNVERKLQRD